MDILLINRNPEEIPRDPKDESEKPLSKAFMVNDTNGEATVTSMIAHSVYDESTSTLLVTTLEETKHNLETV